MGSGELCGEGYDSCECLLHLGPETRLRLLLLAPEYVLLYAEWPMHWVNRGGPRDEEQPNMHYSGNITKYGR